MTIMGLYRFLPSTVWQSGLNAAQAASHARRGGRTLKGLPLGLSSRECSRL